MTLFDRLRIFLERFRGSIQPTGTMSAPTAQHEQKTVEQKFREEHGYSMAGEADAWSEDISQHNAEVQAEYDAEVERRKAAMLAGTYQPRYATSDYMHRMELRGDERPPLTPDDIDWHLEMATRPGARADVTTEPGVQMQPDANATTYAQAEEVRHMRQTVASLENQNASRKLADEAKDVIGGMVPTNIRLLIGTRAKILAAVGGNERLADQVEDKARDTFGTDDLDAPYCGPTEKYLARG